MKVIDILFAAPIPRGHRVEVTWYAKTVTGLLSGRRLQEFPYHPVVRDLDTGIVYGSFDFFWRQGAVSTVSTETPTSLELDVLPEFSIASRLIGTVISCRVATYDLGIGSSRMLKIQTTLVIEPDEQPE